MIVAGAENVQKSSLEDHCEKSVKEALEAIDGIEEAVADHNTDSVKITMSKEVSEETIKEVILGKGYEYLGIKNA